jgi:outer membrane biosynthesis protein TonB
VPAAVVADVPPPPAPPADEMPAPVEERLALARESDVSVTDDRVKPRPEPRPTKDATRPAARLRDPEVASRPPEPRRPEPAPRPAAATPPAGFSGLRTPTRLRGTISNQGPASVDAEDTPTGRYMKQVTTAIEKEWHRKRRMNRDFVTFGTIKLEFFVNARGEVQNLTIKNRSGANAVMQDFTLNAVLDAAIPPMPAGLTEILDREQLLISYDIIVY